MALNDILAWKVSKPLFEEGQILRMNNLGYCLLDAFLIWSPSKNAGTILLSQTYRYQYILSSCRCEASSIQWSLKSPYVLVKIFSCASTMVSELNKAGYTATEVACGWAGAIFEVTRPFGQEQWGQKNKIIKKRSVTDRPTDPPTDKAGCRVACTRVVMK